jgi:hypothetical protein
MSSDLFAPMPDVPATIEAVRDIIRAGLQDLDLPMPKVELRSSAHPDPTPENAFIWVEGEGPDDWCWLMFYYGDPELTGDPKFGALASVTTRGNWAFASAVIYACAIIGGGTIDNCNGAFEGELEYTPEAFRTVVLSFVDRGKP